MKFLLGRKMQMSQQFSADGAVVPVTVVQVRPNVVAQVKIVERDGYQAVQVAEGKRKQATKPLAGHLKEIGPVASLREFRVAAGETIELTRGQGISVEQFQSGDRVMVTGVSKGKGFQGVVRRHHFHGHPASHGHEDQERMPGSIGAGGVQHTRKGRRMAGHMGDRQLTVHGLRVVSVDQEHQQLAISGALPGSRNGLLLIQADQPRRQTRAAQKRMAKVS